MKREDGNSNKERMSDKTLRIINGILFLINFFAGLETAFLVMRIIKENVHSWAVSPYTSPSWVFPAGLLWFAALAIMVLVVMKIYASAGESKATRWRMILFAWTMGVCIAYFYALLQYDFLL